MEMQSSGAGLQGNRKGTLLPWKEVGKRNKVEPEKGIETFVKNHLIQGAKTET